MRLSWLFFISTSIKTYETLPVRLNSDGTISFTVAHFSYFAFVETKQTKPADPAQSSGSASSFGHDTASYSSASGHDSGTEESIAVEPWKPTTLDEIKRYFQFQRNCGLLTVNSK